MTPEVEAAAEKRIARVRHLQDAVAVLLRYNSEAAFKSTPEELIRSVAPVLRKSADEVDEEGEIALWRGCDRLTQMIAPTTLESAKLVIELADWETTENRKERLPSADSVHCCKWLWVSGAIACLFVYIVAQSGAVILGRALEDLKYYQAQMEDIAQQRVMAKDSGSGFLDRLEAKRTNAEAGLVAARRTIIAFPWVPELEASDLSSEMVNGSEVRDEIASARATETYGRIYLDVLQGYLIPVLLGLIGACAYIIRQFSWSIANHTYRAANRIRDWVRIVQGATFGALAGILVSALGGEVRGGEFSIPLVALLFGYSSDLAFKTADQLINRFKNWIKPTSESTKASSRDVPDSQIPGAG
ncbi:hypothetical protein [Oleispirillum naphthae]|uniref:hypothetical protein n=1 Tax=Oleispirillum naphthae TaxID=2838853 RepID=UPI0030824A45